MMTPPYTLKFECNYLLATEQEMMETDDQIISATFAMVGLSNYNSTAE